MNKFKELFLSFLRFIDNGKILINPLKWWFVVKAVLPFILPVAFLIGAIVAIVEVSDYAGVFDIILAIIFTLLAAAVLAVVCYLNFLFWMDRKRRIDSEVKVGDRIVAIPLCAYNVECNGVCAGVFTAVIPSLGAIYLFLLSLCIGGRFLPFKFAGMAGVAGIFVVILVIAGAVVLGWFTIMVSKLMAESMKMFAQMTNDLRDVADIGRAAVMPEQPAQPQAPAYDEPADYDNQPDPVE